ncbi:MAG: glycosyltransferase [Solirubrobacteraceae bacterium]|nr:glycosyltransferase [Solirubrobacteraceae bacterium]
MPSPLASIVIPAHNESAAIDGLLTCLTAEAAGTWEIVVVCNACSDDTAQKARTYTDVVVVETSTPGKLNALNLGDRHVRHFPRVYVDADAVVSNAALRHLVSALDDPLLAAVGSPRLTVDTGGCSRWIQIYFSVWRRLRYAQEAIGSGVYGLSKAARSRFDEFPDGASADQLIYRLFTAEERRITEPGFTYRAPRSIGSLIRTRARMFALNAELERLVELPSSPSVGWRAQGLEDLLRLGPRMVLRVGVFVGIQLVIRGYGRRLAAKSEIPWNQDRTSRET